LISFNDRGNDVNYAWFNDFTGDFAHEKLPEVKKISQKKKKPTTVNTAN